MTRIACLLASACLLVACAAGGGGDDGDDNTTDTAGPSNTVKSVCLTLTLDESARASVDGGTPTAPADSADCVIVVNDPGPDQLSAAFDTDLELEDAAGNRSSHAVTVTLNAP